MNNHYFKFQKYETKFSYAGKRILETVFTSDVPRSKAKVIEAIKEAQKICLNSPSKKLLNYDFIVSLKFDGGWRSDKMFSITDEPVLFDPEEHIESSGSNVVMNPDGTIKKKKLVDNQTEFKAFSIFLIPKSAPKGGCTEKDKNNDCLFYTLAKLVNGKQYMLHAVDTPANFKKAIKLRRADKVPISKMRDVENAMKCNINVVGDYTYTSPNNYIRTLNVQLINEHYTIDANEKVKKFNLIPNRKEVAFYKLVNDTYHIITQEKEWTVQKSENVFLNQLYPNLMLVQKQGDKKTLKEKFEEYQQAQKQLLKETNNFINLDTFPFESQMAKYIFYHRSTSIPEPEQMGNLESNWFYDSFQGGLMYSQDGEYKDAVCIDQNSMYSYYMSHPNLYIPWKQGTFQVLKDKDVVNFIPYGIYRCIITSTNNKLNKFFRFNRNNKYTHFDISLARLLNFTVELIQDEEANCLTFDSSKRIQSNQVYGATVEYLYDLKKKVPYVKKIMSPLWGSQCEKNIKKVREATDKNEIVELDINFRIETIEKYDDCCKVKMVGKSKIFKTDYARMGTFLTSYCRFSIVKTMMENVKNTDNIIRINTDGYITINEEIPTKILGDDLGFFKIEKCGDCDIKNVNTVYWYN